tara:strand:+ start:219 stop:650 length:432 start_codon:yes stop_codon:yes gene_type:complete
VNISRQTILSQARESEKVQRLSREGVGPSGSKRHPSRTDEDIVSSAWRHAAAKKGGNKLAICFEEKSYMSDFGTLQVVPNRFSRERDAYLIDPDMVELVTLRDMAVTELAKTGDASKFMTLVEYGLQVNNEAGLGIAADLTTS